MKQFFAEIVLSVRQARRKLATVGVLVLTAAVAYHVVFGANGAMIYSKKKDEYRRLQKENLDLEQENKDLAAHAKALKTDPRAIEREARESLHYVRPGEVVYSAPVPLATPDRRMSAENQKK